MPPLMPDEVKNFGGSLVLDFGEWWRHVKTIYLHIKFSSNNVDVACCLHLSRKILKRDRNCHLYIINK